MHKKYMNMSVGDYFCKEIKELSSEIGRIGLAQDFINLKNERDSKCKKIRAFYMKVKLKVFHFKLWKRITILYKDYVEFGKPTLFLNDDTIDKYYTSAYEGFNRKLYKYDPEEIDPINLWVLFMFSNMVITEGALFKERKEFKEILKEKGYPELSKYLDEYCVYFDRCIEEL